jgi:hypothetical protein
VYLDTNDIYSTEATPSFPSTYEEQLRTRLDRYAVNFPKMNSRIQFVDDIVFPLDPDEEPFEYAPMTIVNS